jgi:hypothetical protein
MSGRCRCRVTTCITAHDGAPGRLRFSYVDSACLGRRIGGFLPALLVLASCGLGPVDVFRPLPAHSLGPSVDSEAFEGHLRFEGSCVYLAEEGIDLNILWPDGYGLRGDPPAIIRDDGTPIASVGDKVTIGGLSLDDQTATPGCSVRRALALGAISSVNGVDVPAPSIQSLPQEPAMTERVRPR